MRRRRLGEGSLNVLGMGGLLTFYVTQTAFLFSGRDATGLFLPAFIALLIGCLGLVTTSIRAGSGFLAAVNVVATGFTAATIVGIILWS
jgi:hypothetical protein